MAYMEALAWCQAFHIDKRKLDSSPLNLPSKSKITALRLGSQKYHLILAFKNLSCIRLT